MRLTPRQLQTVRRVLRRHFGGHAKIWLFGSRVRDEARGGDYDFMVQTDIHDPGRLVDGKLKALTDLHATPEFEGDKIDLVIQAPLHDRPLPIHEVAHKEGVLL